MTTLASTWTKCNYEFSTYFTYFTYTRKGRRNIIVVVILADYSCTHIESTEYHHNTQWDNNTVVVAVTNTTHRVTFHVANVESWIVSGRGMSVNVHLVECFYGFLYVICCKKDDLNALIVSVMVNIINMVCWKWE